MKKLLYVFLALVLLVSVLAIPAYASGGTTVVTITPDKTQVSAGDTVTFTMSVDSISGTVSSIQGTITATEGLTYTSHQILCYDDGFDTAGGFTPGSVALTLSQANGVSVPFEIISITYTARKDVDIKNLQSVTFDVIDFGTDEADSDLITGSVKSTEVAITHDDAGDHTEDAGTVTKAASCLKPGTKQIKCMYCGAVIREEELPALGHEIEGEPTFTFDGNADSCIATVTVKCTHENCDLGLYNNGQGKTYSNKVPSDEFMVGRLLDGPTCGKPGSVTWLAILTLPDKDNTTLKYEKQDGPYPVDKLDHTWDWKCEWDTDDPEHITATFTIQCMREGCQYNTDPYVKEAELTSAPMTDPTCEKPGTVTWTATAKAPEGEATFIDHKDNVIVPALGHKWDTATATWTWDGADDVYDNTAPTAKVKVMCLNAGKCDSKYDTDGLVIDAKVEPDDTLSTVPTCTTGGAVTFNATAVTTDHFEGTEQKAETFTSSTKETYTALGHDFQGKPVVEWPASVDGTNPPEIKEAKLYCAREKTDVVTQATRVNEIKDDPAKWADPTYQAPGKRTYTVTAQFGTGIGNEVIYVTTDEKTYELPKLAPTAGAPESEVNASGVTVKDTPAADVIQTQVQNALQGSASGLDAKLAAELKELGESKTSGMTVETKLVVDPKAAPTVDPVTDAGTKLAATYDIHIDVTVTGGGITGELKGNIEQTDDPISFSVPKPEGGPIYIVMRYHDGQWQTIPSAVNGNNIEFSSDRFSEFAILSSNDLKYAVIDPIPDQTYTGSEIRPAVKVTINGGTELTAGTDYTVEYADNVNVGTAAVTIKAVENGGYTGSQTVNFRIVEKPAAGGSGSGSGTKNAPATGDETPVALYAGILALSATALTVVCFRRKKSH